MTERDYKNEVLLQAKGRPFEALFNFLKDFEKYYGEGYRLAVDKGVDYYPRWRGNGYFSVVLVKSAPPSGDRELISKEVKLEKYLDELKYAKTKGSITTIATRNGIEIPENVETKDYKGYVESVLVEKYNSLRDSAK